MSQTLFTNVPFTVIPLVSGIFGGKEIASAKLVADAGLLHVGIGEVLRKKQSYVDYSDPDSRTISELQKARALVSTDTTLELLAEHVNTIDLSQYSGIILEGFPRRMDQLDRLNEFGESVGADIIQGYYLDVSVGERRRRAEAAAKERAIRNDGHVPFDVADKFFQEETIPLLRRWMTERPVPITRLSAADCERTKRKGSELCAELIKCHLATLWEEPSLLTVV